MPASFNAGASKVFTGTAPRFVVVTGSEPGLRAKVLEFYTKQRAEVHIVHDAVSTVFMPPLAKSRSKIVIVKSSHSQNWDWLPLWLNVVKKMQLIVEVTDPKVAVMLEKKANTRGLAIDCSVPNGDKNRAKLADRIHNWYGVSTSQLTLLFARNDWNVTACLTLLDKLALLGLPLTSETESKLRVVHDVRKSFLEALYDNAPAKAMTYINKLPDEEVCGIIESISNWLQKMFSVKFTATPLKQTNAIARELGIEIPEAAKLMQQARKFDLDQAVKLNLVLAQASSAAAGGATHGVLENLVGNW